MRLLTDSLGSEFELLLKKERVKRVDVASAWATEGPGLDALERATRRRKVKVRALVGVAGGHTTPSALKKLDKIGKLRLVDGGSLFHVKLYLFRGRGTPIAWIGSANFTRPGFENNEELILETTDIAVAADWFSRRWEGIDPGQSRKRLQEYCKTWEPPAAHQLGVDDEPTSEANVENSIVFFQEGKRPPPFIKGGHKHKPPRGTVKVAGRSYPYKSAQEVVRLVLRALHREDASFLRRCDEDPRFHGKKTHLIARSKDGLGTRQYQEYAKEICDGWWMSTQTQTREKWETVKWAAEVAGLQVEVEGKYWRAEAKSKVKVGF